MKAGKLLPYTQFLLVKAKSTLDRFSSKTVVNPSNETRQQSNTVTTPKADTSSSNTSRNSTPDRNTSPLLFDDNVSMETELQDVAKGDSDVVSMVTKQHDVARGNNDAVSMVTEQQDIVKGESDSISMVMEQQAVTRGDSATPDSLDSSFLLFDDNDSAGNPDLDKHHDPANRINPEPNDSNTHQESTEFTHLKDNVTKNDGDNSRTVQDTSNQQSFAEKKSAVELGCESKNVVPLKQQDNHVSGARPAKDFGRGGDQTNLVSEFYAHSRLHHISTWGAEFKAYVNQLQAKGDTSYPGRAKLKRMVQTGEIVDSPSDVSLALSLIPPRVIMHIDMDCFFVSVGLRNRPELIGEYLSRVMPKQVVRSLSLSSTQT